jgi:ribonuclease D
MVSDFAQNITREEIDQLPLKTFKGDLIVVDTFEKINKSVEYLQKQRILGFDTETKPSFKKGKKNIVAMLQLSSAGKAFIFRLNKIGLPEGLAKILANPKIIKAGADIKQDLSALQKLGNFIPDGFIDIQKFSNEFGIIDNGLKKLTAIILGFKISKAQRLTNWEAPELTSSQLVYAATDAWVCYLIFSKLHKILNGK